MKVMDSPSSPRRPALLAALMLVALLWPASAAHEHRCTSPSLDSCPHAKLWNRHHAPAPRIALAKVATPAAAPKLLSIPPLEALWQVAEEPVIAVALQIPAERPSRAPPLTALS